HAIEVFGPPARVTPGRDLAPRRPEPTRDEIDPPDGGKEDPHAVPATVGDPTADRPLHRAGRQVTVGRFVVQHGEPLLADFVAAPGPPRGLTHPLLGRRGRRYFLRFSSTLCLSSFSMTSSLSEIFLMERMLLLSLSFMATVILSPSTV